MWKALYYVMVIITSSLFSDSWATRQYLRSRERNSCAQTIANFSMWRPTKRCLHITIKIICCLDRNSGKCCLTFSLPYISPWLHSHYSGQTIHTQVAILMAELLSQVGPPVQVTKSRGYNVWLWILPGFHIFCEPQITRILFSSRACKDVQLCIWLIWSWLWFHERPPLQPHLILFNCLSSSLHTFVTAWLIHHSDRTRLPYILNNWRS